MFVNQCNLCCIAAVVLRTLTRKNGRTANVDVNVRELFVLAIHVHVKRHLSLSVGTIPKQ